MLIDVIYVNIELILYIKDTTDFSKVLLFVLKTSFDTGTASRSWWRWYSENTKNHLSSSTVWMCKKWFESHGRESMLSHPSIQQFCWIFKMSLTLISHCGDIKEQSNLSNALAYMKAALLCHWVLFGKQEWHQRVGRHLRYDYTQTQTESHD